MNSATIALLSVLILASVDSITCLSRTPVLMLVLTSVLMKPLSTRPCGWYRYAAFVSLTYSSPSAPISNCGSSRIFVHLPTILCTTLSFLFCSRWISKGMAIMTFPTKPRIAPGMSAVAPPIAFRTPSIYSSSVFISFSSSPEVNAPNSACCDCTTSSKPGTISFSSLCESAMDFLSSSLSFRMRCISFFI